MTNLMYKSCHTALYYQLRVLPMQEPTQVPTQEPTQVPTQEPPVKVSDHWLNVLIFKQISHGPNTKGLMSHMWSRSHRLKTAVLTTTTRTSVLPAFTSVLPSVLLSEPTLHPPVLFLQPCVLTADWLQSCQTAHLWQIQSERRGLYL